MKPLYSICITNYNTEDSVRDSLESIIAQLDNRFEIVVVDNCSTDASQEILKDYERRHVIKLIVKRCSRGLGRQIALEKSTGKYVISQMDMDDVFKPCLNKLLQIYHANFENYMLVTSEVIMIAPRELVNTIGGYHDLNYLEETDLYSRAAQIGYFKYFSFKLKECEIKKRKPERRIKRVIEQQYSMYRESFRIGQGTTFFCGTFLKPRNLRIKPFVFLTSLLVFPWAFINHWFYPQFYNDFIRFFDETNYEVKLNEISDK
jgi:glycosyltransferase involved in cell wall biosynthesis